MKISSITFAHYRNTPIMARLAMAFMAWGLVGNVEATESLTQVTQLNTRYEFVHYLKVEDAEVLLARMGAEGSIATTKGLTLLARYVEANFQASSESGIMGIETLSAEVDDRFVYIEQMTITTPGEWLPPQLELESRLLKDLDTEAVSYIEMHAGPQSSLMRVTTGQPVQVLKDRASAVLY